jgi:hypothetical protein
VWCCGNNHEEGAADKCTGQWLGLKTRYFCWNCGVNLCGERQYSGVSCFVLWHAATELNNPCVRVHVPGIQVRRRHGNRDKRAILCTNVSDANGNTNYIDDNAILSDNDTSYGTAQQQDNNNCFHTAEQKEPFKTIQETTPMRTTISKEVTNIQLVTSILRNSVYGIE